MPNRAGNKCWSQGDKSLGCALEEVFSDQCNWVRESIPRKGGKGAATADILSWLHSRIRGKGCSQLPLAMSRVCHVQLGARQSPVGSPVAPNQLSTGRGHKYRPCSAAGRSRRGAIGLAPLQEIHWGHSIRRCLWRRLAFGGERRAVGRQRAGALPCDLGPKELSLILHVRGTDPALPHSAPVSFSHSFPPLNRLYPNILFLYKRVFHSDTALLYLSAALFLLPDEDVV